MFSLFNNKKPLLKDIIPSNFTDIHSHLLWGLDDGAPSETESESMIAQLKHYGFGRCITTPHIMTHIWENTAEIILNKEKEWESKSQYWNTKIPIKAAAEYLLDNNFKKKLEQDKLLTLKDNIVLVELSYSNPPIQLYEIIFELQLKGYKPLLAHPERYLYYTNKFSEFNQLKKAGCLFQLNVLTTTGYYGKDVANLAHKLLAGNLYDFVGSDIHNQNHMNQFDKPVILKNLNALREVMEKNAYFNWEV